VFIGPLIMKGDERGNTFVGELDTNDLVTNHVVKEEAKSQTWGVSFSTRETNTLSVKVVE